MDYVNLMLKKQDGAAAITLNCPEKLNAINTETIGEILDALNDTAVDEKIRVVTITGAGRAFCSGADLDSPLFDAENAASYTEGMHRVSQVITAIKELPKPVIAAVNGPAAGIGCNLALACDIILASERAKFIEPFISLGLHPDTGAIYFLPRLVGLAKSSYYLLTGRVIDAREAERIGIVSRLFPGEQLERATNDLALALAKSAPAAIHMTKKSLNQALTMDLPAALEAEARAVAILNTSEDRKEGIISFLEKRDPVFKGR